MIIFAPITPAQTGGTSTFARNFQTIMRSNGHEVTFNYRKDYDVLFVIATCPWRYLFHAKLFKRPIVHRLDGVYTLSTVAGRWYKWHNWPLKIIHKYFSSFTIYQSLYSQYCGHKFLGHRHNELKQIIYNGVDMNVFSPQGPVNQKLRHQGVKTIFITWSKFRRRDQIMPLIEVIKDYRSRYNSNATLVVIGDFVGDVSFVPEVYANIPFITFTGPLNNSDIAAYARAADVFVITHQNPPCPNNVLEAMACGLPICGVADGSMPEITIPGACSELIHVDNDGFTQQRHLNIRAFSDNLQKILIQREKYSKNSLQLVQDKFTIRQMASGYEKVILSLNRQR